MTVKIVFSGLVALATLSACSSVDDREIASGSCAYLAEEPGKVVKIPADIDTPKFNDTYKLPALGEDAPRDVMGPELSVLSPSLVLPLVTGSHVEEGSKKATVWFDQVDDSQALDATIWNSLISFLEEQGIGVETFDKAQQRLITDWMVVTDSDEDSWYTWSPSERSVGQRFEFNLALKPHGRIASLSVDLIDFKEKQQKDGPELTKAKDVRRHEVDILNQVIEHYEYEIRLATAQRILKIRQGLAMELGIDAEGEPAYVVDAEYDITWPRLLLVLKKLGFDVKDYDKSNGLLFVKYNGSEGSWWSHLWSKDENALDLDTQEYRLRVSDVGNKTSVTWLDEESKAFTSAKLNDLFATFSRTMAEDDLDI